jgi:hypothetical protein
VRRALRRRAEIPPEARVHANGVALGYGRRGRRLYPADMSLNPVLDPGESRCHPGEEVGPNEKVDFTLPDRGS